MPFSSQDLTFTQFQLCFGHCFVLSLFVKYEAQVITIKPLFQTMKNVAIAEVYKLDNKVIYLL